MRPSRISSQTASNCASISGSNHSGEVDGMVKPGRRPKHGPGSRLCILYLEAPLRYTLVNDGRELVHQLIHAVLDDPAREEEILDLKPGDRGDLAGAAKHVGPCLREASVPNVPALPRVYDGAVDPFVRSHAEHPPHTPSVPSEVCCARTWQNQRAGPTVGRRSGVEFRTAYYSESGTSPCPWQRSSRLA